MPSTDVPVAIDPALLNKPVSPDQAAGGGDSELLKHKLGLANQHAKQAKKEADEARQQMQQLKDELEQLKTIQQNVAQKSLEESGQFEVLYQRERERAKTLEQRLAAETTELKAQLNSVQQTAEQERLKAAATSAISQANAVNAQQLYALLQPQLRMDDEGKPAVLNGGVEQPLNDYLANLRQSAEWQHHFSASGARGMGSAPASAVAPGMNNPYRTGNLTEALQLETSNPELAKALKAEAARG